MGWKAFKQHFKLDNLIVQLSNGGEFLYLGTEYLPKTFFLNLESGEYKFHPDSLNLTELDEFASKLYELGTEKFLSKTKELLELKDDFTNSITVYTCSGSEVIEKQCEKLGYPNVTHDGELMHNNFFTSKNEAINWGLQVAFDDEFRCQKEVERARRDLKLAEDNLKEAVEIGSKLQSMLEPNPDEPAP